MNVIDEIPEKRRSLEKLDKRKWSKTKSYLFLVASKISNCAKFSEM